MQANTWDAENALGSSVVVNLTTKSGTNHFHGTGSLLYTNQDLQAVPEFSQTVAPFGRKDLVGTLGGPIIKNKLFFFADVEKLWATLPETSSGLISWDDPAFDTWAQANFPSTVGTSIYGLYPTNGLKPNGTVENAQQYFKLATCPVERRDSRRSSAEHRDDSVRDERTGFREPSGQPVLQRLAVQLPRGRTISRRTTACTWLIITIHSASRRFLGARVWM